jgi:hypothetical protein
MEARFEALATVAEAVGAGPAAQSSTVASRSFQLSCVDGGRAGTWREARCPARQPRSEAARKLADQVSSEVCKLLESSSMSYKEGAKLLEAPLSASV